MATNRKLVLQQRPVGMIGPEVFRLEEEELAPLGDGEARVRVEYVGVEPAMRGWLDEGDTYVPAVAIGETMRALGVGEVVDSNTEQYPVGTTVSGLLGWQEHATVGPANPVNPVPPGVASTSAISVFGVTGLTAWFGLHEIGRPEPGDTVLVSGAAGATGSIAGQLAKAVGCKVVGIAGGPEKCAWIVDDLGFDAAIDYKAGDGRDLRRRLGEACPDGVDVFFDNVGGDILEAALDRINMRARIVLCGGISGYNATEPQPGPNNLMQLVIQRGRMEGFIVIDFMGRFPEAIERLAALVLEGKVKDTTQVVEGLERAPEALNMLFTGGNTGKLLVRVS